MIENALKLTAVIFILTAFNSLEYLRMGKGIISPGGLLGIPFAQARLTTDEQDVQKLGFEFVKAESNFNEQTKIALKLAQRDLSALEWGRAANDIAAGIIETVLDGLLKSENPDPKNIKLLIEATKTLGYAARDAIPVFAAHAEKISNLGFNDLVNTASKEIEADTQKSLKVVEQEGIGETAGDIELIPDEQMALKQMAAQVLEGSMNPERTSLTDRDNEGNRMPASLKKPRQVTPSGNETGQKAK